jgi:hypothetical protein
MPLPQYKLPSKSTNRFKRCTLRSLNIRHFEMVEAMGLNNMESRSSPVSPPPYKISTISTNQFKRYQGVLFTHLRSFNVRHFEMVEAEMVEAMGLNSMESRSSSVSPPPYKISTISTNQFKRYQGVLFTHLRSLNVRHYEIKLRD